MSLRKIFSQNSPKKESFDFSSLPWVCQRRFAEICDGETLKTIASINESTRMLSKRCHSVKKISIGCGKIKFYIMCYCKDGEHCNGLEAYQFTIKLKVLDSISIMHSKPEKLNAQFLQRLPINLNSIKRLDLFFHSIDFSFIKTFVTPNLKSLACQGRMLFDIQVKDLKEVLSTLEKFHFTMYYFRDLHSNAVEILSELHALGYKKFHEIGNVISIEKNYYIF